MNERENWSGTKIMGYEYQVRKMINFGGWANLLGIKEKTYVELTLEFLSSFKVDCTYMRVGYNNEVRIPCLEESLNLLTKFFILMEICHAPGTV